MRARAVLLKFHLYLGLTGALFLIVPGLTGSVIAFETDIDHWLHPGLWYVKEGSVKQGAQLLSEDRLIHAAERASAPARVTSVEISSNPKILRVMHLTDGSRLLVNPYDGAIRGRFRSPSRTQIALGWIHQIHLRLSPTPQSTPKLAAAGKVIVSFAGLILCLLVPTGLILFVRTARTKVKWTATWPRVFFDLHHVVGIYAAIWLFIAAFTGIMIGFASGERLIYSVTGSRPPARPPQLHSSPVAGTPPISVDRAIGAARKALPGYSLAGMFLPLDPKGVYLILMRAPEDTSEAVHSSVSVDQYSGRSLDVRDLLADSAGYRVIRFNRSIHTGDVLGLPTHILMSLSSLALAVMAATGLAIWWKKLAV